jgi:hypothetical protein
MADDKVYFAARAAEDCAAALIEKSASFYNTMRVNSFLKKIVQMYHYYYGNFNQENAGVGHEIAFTGEHGELVKLPVNHFRNLAQNILNMIIANRPVLEARAINSDYQALSQTYLANGILDYYMREKGLEEAINECVEMAIVLGASYLKMDWNAMGGEIYEYDPETSEPVFEGELEFSVLSPLDVVVDGTKERWNHEWILTRTYVNRYNLVSKNPELADKIMRVQTKSETIHGRLGYFSNDKTDDIAVYEFYHKRTAAMPEGRYMIFLDKDIVLLDAPLPYREIPIFRLAPANIMGTPYGYTNMFDIYPLQEAINALMSGVLTNQNAFMVQSVFIPKGADITAEQLDGMTLIEANAKPEPIQLTSTPGEVFKMIQDLIQTSEMLTGVSSVTRGQPEASLRSAQALALVQSMSLQFQSSFQQNYVKFLENIGTCLIEILKDFAHTPKLIALVGRNKRPLLKEFKGDMIKDIKKVIVDVGNPLSRTTAGRVQMADQLAQMKLIKNPQQYFMVMETGRLDSMVEGDMSDLLLIKRENEWLLEGKDVFANPLDQHRMHIMEHRAVINDPELRQNPELLTKVQAHLQEHIDMLRQVDPDLLMLINEQPLQNPNAPQQAPMPPQPGQPGGPMGNQSIIQGNPMGEMMDPNQMGPGAAPEMVAGNQPNVDANLLPNPDLDPRAR